MLIFFILTNIIDKIDVNNIDFENWNTSFVGNIDFVHLNIEIKEVIVYSKEFKKFYIDVFKEIKSNTEYCDKVYNYVRIDSIFFQYTCEVKDVFADVSIKTVTLNKFELEQHILNQIKTK